MPQLPSGRHVGLLATALNELLKDPEYGLNIPLLLGMKSLEDLPPYINVILLLELIAFSPAAVQ